MSDEELVERCWEVLAQRRSVYPMGAQMIDRDDLAAIIPIVAAEQRERDARYEAAWRDLFEPLAWMQGHPDLPVKYLGQNLAWAASDLIAEAYPEFSTAIRKGAE